MKYILFNLALFLLPVTLFAAEMRVTVPLNTPAVGDTFIVEVTLISEDEALNAIEGVLELSSSLTLKEVRTAQSIVPLWVEKPLGATLNRISFVGVIPGGFQGLFGSSWKGMRPGSVMSLVLEATSAGEASVSFLPGVRVLSNDGFGTPLPLQVYGALFSISDAGAVTEQVSNMSDTIAPEPFELQIVDGREYGKDGFVLVFNTADKQSGMSRYEIALSDEVKKENELSWTPIESPYGLSQKDITRYIFVRALDKEGNSRVAFLPPSSTVVEQQTQYLWFILLVVTFGLVWFFLKRFIAKKGA